MNAYADRKAELVARLAAGAGDFGLDKDTSNLFRDRAPRPRVAIDLKVFNHVVAVDEDAGLVEAEGMVRYVDLVDATLAHGTVPAVVPQLKSITLGGAVAGVGIEATSFRQGLVHDAVVALDVLTGDGRILVCTADNEYRDLFFGFPNSYGTLGYALKVTSRTLPVKPFVVVEHHRYPNAEACFADLARFAADPGVDFLDGVVFASDELYLSPARFVPSAPYTSDYSYQRIYYRSIRERSSDFLTARDYLWRWDTDWFWCSKNVGAQNPLLRRLYGPARLNSITYQKIMRWNSRWGLTRALARLTGSRPESVIQDVDIPLARAAEFLDFFHAKVGILPVWICPVRAALPGARFPLYPLREDTLYVNFGFWDVVHDRRGHPPGFHNRAIERRVTELGGIKSLYSDSYFGEEEFWSIYDRGAYSALKLRYDPKGKLPDLYDKVVRGSAAPQAR
jgi:FAD/FMN-containing dehydrogenase